jgi:hypothetical protein
LAWRLRDELSRLTSVGICLQLIATEKSLDELNTSQLAELAALVEFVGADLYKATTMPVAGDPVLPLILGIGSDQFHACWVASDDSALAPVTRWGNGDNGAQYVLRRTNQAIGGLPDTWKKIDPGSLRATQPGLLELKIGQELNGASLSFGDRAWTFIMQQTPKMTELLNGNVALAEIRYADRYLRSPLVLLLLHSLLDGLSAFSGGLSVTTRVLIQTTQLERVGTEQSRRIYHNWREGEDRREVVNAWFGEHFSNFHWNDKSTTNESPHERTLELIWADGSQYKITLDQGLGYWRIVSGIRAEFPFESDVGQQVGWLNRANIMIESVSKTSPTHWYWGSL